MTIASEITNYANGLGDAYDAVNDMGGVIPQDKNMNNLDTSIRTIPQNLGPTYVAGNGIDITNDTISIDDTVVAELSDLPGVMTGATSGTAGTSGLVPAPAAGDQDKVLKGDGTWGDAATSTTTYYLPNVPDNVSNPFSVYEEDSLATAVTAKQIYDAFMDGGVILRTTESGVFQNNGYQLTSAMYDEDDHFYNFSFEELGYNRYFGFGGAANATTFTMSTVYLQKELTAGSNISIASNGTISATDTTYSDFGGATSSVAGSAGLVPAPTTSDPDKFLKGDGTWGTPTDTTYSAGTNVQISAGNVISATDTTYSNFTGATSSVAGANGLVPAPAAGDQEKVLHGDGTWKDATAKLVEMSYGESSAWAKFIAAYNAGSIVYCRASSNANPGTGSQTRKAFMAYVNNATSPTNVEFQYVRSQSSKTDSQQCDQVFVYTLTNTNGGTWSVASRNMSPKINVDGPITKTFTTGANATVTIGANAMTGATSGAAGAAGVVPAPAAGDQDKVLTGAGTWDTRAKITMTSTDPGSGSALAADNYVAVYGNSDGQITSTDLANNSVATANLQDYSVTRVKLNHLDLVNNGEWVCVGYAYLGATTDSTVAVTVDIPADYQGQKMQYKVVGAYECPSVNGSTKYTRVEVKIGGVWKTSNVFNSYQGVVNGNWAWYGGSGSAGYSGTAAWFGHEWTTASDWDSCAFEFIASSCYPGSHWAFSGTAGGMSGGHPGTLNYGGRVQDGNAIQAFRLACAASVKWGQGAGLAVYVRRKNF